jgi:large conductance mechanosensitive channel
MGFLADFKKFAMRGNVVDLAVGVIIGAAFGGVTKSMVDDVMMPPLGIAMGAVDFKEQYIPLTIRDAASSNYAALKKDLLDAEIKRVEEDNAKAAKENRPTKPLPTSVRPTLDQMNAKGIPTLRYGLFINTIINFIFVAFGVFLIVKLMSKMQKSEPPPAMPAKEEILLTEIRDLLKAKPAR